MDAKLNPNAAPNPDFIPNLASPSFPSYISGHSAFSAAGALLSSPCSSARMTFRSAWAPTGLPGVVHSFKSFSDAQREAGMSRVWGGIHTMLDNLEAQKTGVAIADWVYAHALLPDSK